MTHAYLPERALIRIGGDDANTFLHNLITTDVEGLPEGEARPGALLTPQGKILFDFLIWRDSGGFLLETDAVQRDGLLKRLAMYKLRAAVELSAETGDGVTVFWDGEGGGIVDGRFAKAGLPVTRQPGKHGDGGPEAYDALRIGAGIAHSGSDFALQDAFPHDALIDLNGGLSFRKGCYVGQEVVSRMQHRSTARRRVAIISAENALPPAGTELTAGGKPVGTLGTVVGNQGLAIIRIDRAGEAIADGSGVFAGDVPVSARLPQWTGLSFPTSTDEAQA